MQFVLSPKPVCAKNLFVKFIEPNWRVELIIRVDDQNCLLSLHIGIHSFIHFILSMKASICMYVPVPLFQRSHSNNHVPIQECRTFSSPDSKNMCPKWVRRIVCLEEVNSSNGSQGFKDWLLSVQLIEDSSILASIDVASEQNRDKRRPTVWAMRRHRNNRAFHL